MRLYVDCETVGLDPERHEVFEVAWAREEGPVKRLVLPHLLTWSDPESLRINGYHERGIAAEPVATGEQIMEWVNDMRGATLVCANPPFDRERISRFLRRWWPAEDPEPWHHRSIDIESQAALVLDLDEPPSMTTIVNRLNDEYDACIQVNDHTAVGDVMTMRQVMAFIDGWRSTVGLARQEAHPVRSGPPGGADAPLTNPEAT